MKTIPKKLIALFVTLIMIFVMAFATVITTGAVAAEDLTVEIDTGASITLKDTDADGYYEIGSADELYAFAAAVNGEKNNINAELTDDIVINENVLDENGSLNGTPARKWTPIGDLVNQYEGTFDGAFHTISGIYCVDDYYVGLFGSINSTGAVKNLGILDAYFDGSGRSASISYRNAGIIENCFSTATIIGTTKTSVSNYFGGIAAYTKATVRNCYFAGKMTISGGFTGAITGYNDTTGTVENCYYDSTKCTKNACGSNRGTCTDTLGKPTNSFSSGEVASLLGAPYGQKIGTDALPKFSSNTVYNTIIGGNSRDGFSFSYTNTYYPVALEEALGDAVGFPSIEAAIDVAKTLDYSKISLFDDVIITNELEIDVKSLDIDLCGYKISSESSCILHVANGTVNLTSSIAGGEIVSSLGGSFAIYNYGKLSIKDVTIEGDAGILNSIYNENTISLTLDNVNVKSVNYPCFDNRGAAIIKSGRFEVQNSTETAIQNLGYLIINDLQSYAKNSIINIQGTTTVISGSFNSPSGYTIILHGGRVNISGGTYEGAVYLSENSELSISGGVFPTGLLVNGADLNSVIEDGHTFYDGNFVKIVAKAGDTEIAEKTYVYPDKAACVVDSELKLVQSFDEISAALVYADLNDLDVLFLRDSSEDLNIPEGVSLYAGNNVLSGEITNRGNIVNGIFTGGITNTGGILGGSFYSDILSTDAGRITKGYFDGSITLMNGAIFINSGDIILGDGFAIFNKGGTIDCTSHIGPATCIAPGICRICGNEHEPINPDAHLLGTPATCISLAVCELCGDGYGEYSEHVFLTDGTCETDGCETVAIVMVANKYYTSLEEAILKAPPNEIIYALRDFELTADTTVNEQVYLYAHGFTITLNGCDLIVKGTILNGEFICEGDASVRIEHNGIIDYGTFKGDKITNNGTILGGQFYVNEIFNDTNGSIENEGNVFFPEETEITGTGNIYCLNHFGGEKTCTTGELCNLCGNQYGVKLGHSDENFDHVCENGCGEKIGEHKDDNRDHNCDWGCNVAIEPCADSDSNHTCDYCGTPLSTCTFTTPTCTKAAECTLCKKVNGTTLPHTYDNACDTDCNACGAEREVGEHYSENADGKCDACGESFKLSGGEIAGIASGSAVAAGVGGFSLFWFVIKKKSWSDLVGLFRR